jgi:hypothetical protein
MGLSTPLSTPLSKWKIDLLGEVSAGAGNGLWRYFLLIIVAGTLLALPAFHRAELNSKQLKTKIVCNPKRLLCYRLADLPLPILLLHGTPAERTESCWKTTNLWILFCH